MGKFFEKVVEQVLAQSEQSSLYIGDEMILIVNRIWFVFYSLISFLFIVACYQIVRNQWPRWVLIPIIVNIVTTFSYFPVVSLGTKWAVIGGSIGLMVMTLSAFILGVFFIKYKWWLSILFIPYIIWCLYITILTWDISLNI